VVLSFLLMVVGPIGVAGWYLWERAAPRFVSYSGFSVRTEDMGSATDLLGNISALSGSSSSDTDILYNFIRSQELVRIVDKQLDLRALWSKPDSDVDPIYSYHAPGNIEDLTAYWARMVKVYNDAGSGLIDMAVQAFEPEDATRIAVVIYDESSKMINRLSSIARDDAISFAREELTATESGLRDARLFRNNNQVVDPSASLQGLGGARRGCLRRYRHNLPRRLLTWTYSRKPPVRAIRVLLRSNVALTQSTRAFQTSAKKWVQTAKVTGLPSWLTNMSDCPSICPLWKKPTPLRAPLIHRRWLSPADKTDILLRMSVQRQQNLQSTQSGMRFLDLFRCLRSCCGCFLSWSVMPSRIVGNLL
jgi:hypothetical protein